MNFFFFKFYFIFNWMIKWEREKKKSGKKRRRASEKSHQFLFFRAFVSSSFLRLFYSIKKFKIYYSFVSLLLLLSLLLLKIKMKQKILFINSWGNLPPKRRINRLTWVKKKKIIIIKKLNQKVDFISFHFEDESFNLKYRNITKKKRKTTRKK